jgi:hypothetical protein
MSNTQYVWGAGGLVVGVLIGTLIGGGPSEKDVQYAVSKAIAKSQEAAAAGDKARTEAMAAIQSQLESLQKSVSDSSGAASDQASSMSDRLAALEKSVKDNAGAVSSDVGEKLAQLGAVVEKGLGETRDRVAALAAPKADSGATEETGAEPSKPAAAAAAPSAAPADGLGAGETRVLADGALRVFVSRVDDGSAKLFVNGGSRTATAGESFAVETDGGSCTVKVGQIGGGKVEIGGQCGEPALPGTAPAEIKPGHATVLEDGRIKVFLSSVTPTGAARIAVNGLDTIDVDPGGRVDTNAPDGTPCHVMVDAVKDQTVSVSGTCG